MIRTTVRTATLALACGVVLTGCAVQPYTPPPQTPTSIDPGTATPTSTPTNSPSASTAPTPDVPRQDAFVYFPRESSRGVRLGREVRQVPQADPLLGAVRLMVEGPADPDYHTSWAPGTEVLSVTTEGDVTTVDFSEQARDAELSRAEAAVTALQLVWTVTEQVGRSTTVDITIEGEPAGELWGLDWTGPQGRTEAVGDRVLVSIDTPSEGDTVSSPVTIVGDAAAFEANVLWTITDDAGAVVAEGFTTAEEAMRFTPYSFTVTLEPGTYTVEVSEDDVSDGEGFRPDTDTRTFTVE